MNSHFSGCKLGISRSSLNICAVLVILLINVHTNLARIYPRPPIDGDELVWVAMVHRHGDRTPLGTYPNDPYKNHSWPGGLGALTQLGIRQLYEVGCNVRPRYESLKPSNGIYSQETVHAVSSSPERTRMSGASMLAGFWQPLEHGKPLTIPWQPVPLEILPGREDYILYQADVKCPKYEKFMNKLITDPDPGSSIYEYNKKNKEFYRYLSKHMGQNVTNIMGPSYLQDSLFIQETNGLKLPAWTRSIYPQPLYDARVRSFQLTTENDFMTRMRAGPIITQIYEEMLKVLSGESSRKILTYSAHDTTIHNILTAMKNYDKVDFIASYGALVAFELYKNKYFCRENTVRMVYYANSTVKIPERLKIPGCPGPCYFSDFEDLIEPFLITDYHSECKV